MAKKNRRKSPRLIRPAVEFLEDRTLPSLTPVLALVVNLPGDAGASSGATSGDIRYCINQANSNPGSTITFNTVGAGATILLTHGELPISA